jgi:hypothetical protein
VGQEEQRRSARSRRDPEEAAAEDLGLLGFRPSTPASGGGNMGNAVGGGSGLRAPAHLAVWLASGFYIVDEGRRGVVLRLGRYLETTSRARAGTSRIPSRRWRS